MFCAQVVISSLGAARIHRGLVDFPALHASVKTAHGTGEHAREPVSPQSWRTKRGHDTEDVGVVLNAPPGTTCSTEIHKETFEGANTV